MNEPSNVSKNPPDLVVRAAALIAISAILGVLRLVIDYDQVVQPGGEVLVIAVFLVMIGLMLLFAFMAMKGKNWARIVFLVLVLMGLLPAIAIVGEELRRNVFLSFVSLTQAGCQVAAIVMFFMPRSNEWYREVKAARQS